MHIPPLIHDLALLLISAGITTIIFKWLKQPVVLGYIVAGCLVSSQISLTPDISGTSDINSWSELGVIFLLFSLGIDFSFKKLINVGKTAAIGACVIVSSMILAGFIVGLLIGMSSSASLLLGCMISMSSTAIIVKAFDDAGLQNQPFAKNVYGILIFEDLIAIVLMVLISTLAGSNSFEGIEIFIAVVKLFFFLVVWMISGIYFFPTLLKRARKVMNDETLLIVSIGFCFGMVIFAMQVGFSSALGAFIAGSVLAETLEAEQFEKLIKPIKDLFGAIFFVSVGMMLDFTTISDHWSTILILSCTVIIGQIVFASSGLLIAGQSINSAIQSGFCLTQIGEFAFIIAMLGINMGLIDSHIYPIIVAVSVLTIFLTPYIMKLSGPAYRLIEKHLPEKWINGWEEKNRVKSSTRENSLWEKLLTDLCKIIAIYSILIIAIIMLMTNYLSPFLSSLIGEKWTTPIVAILTATLTAPLIRAIIAKKNHSHEYKTLRKKGKNNQNILLALIIFRGLIGGGFICYICYNFLNLHFITSVLISCAYIALIMRSRRIKFFSIRLERIFLLNLYSREYLQTNLKKDFNKNRLYNQLKDYDIHFSDFEIDSTHTPLIGKRLKDLKFQQRYGVHLVSIIRGTARINIPGGNEALYPSDKILVLGTDKQIEKFEYQFKKLSNIRSREEKMHGVRISQFTISSNSHLNGKTILESAIRENFRCMIVGIEKKGIATMNPAVNTLFEEGDIVWIAGETAKIKTFLKGEESLSITDEQ